MQNDKLKNITDKVNVKNTRDARIFAELNKAHEKDVNLWVEQSKPKIKITSAGKLQQSAASLKRLYENAVVLCASYLMAQNLKVIEEIKAGVMDKKNMVIETVSDYVAKKRFLSKFKDETGYKSVKSNVRVAKRDLHANVRFNTIHGVTWASSLTDAPGNKELYGAGLGVSHYSPYFVSKILDLVAHHVLGLTMEKAIKDGYFPANLKDMDKADFLNYANKLRYCNAVINGVQTNLPVFNGLVIDNMIKHIEEDDYNSKAVSHLAKKEVKSLFNRMSYDVYGPRKNSKVFKTADGRIPTIGNLPEGESVSLPKTDLTKLLSKKAPVQKYVQIAAKKD